MAEATEIVDAVPVDDDTPLGVAEHAQPSTEIVRRERRSEVMHPLDGDQLVASFAEYQALIPRLLNDGDYQTTGDRNSDGSPKKFKKKSAWRKLATAFDLDVTLVADEVERDESGRIVRAKAVARATAPSGRVVDGDGYCSIDESGRSRDGKAEHNVRSTATTRAKNRAISEMVAAGEVSAEEVSGGDQTPGPPHGPEANAGMTANAKRAAIKLCGGDVEAAGKLFNRVTSHLGNYLPTASAIALICAADALPAPTGDTSDLPWEPEYKDPTGDVPSEEQANAEIAGLEDQALELCGRLWTAQTAKQKVKDAAGNLVALRALVEAAQKALAAKGETVPA